MNQYHIKFTHNSNRTKGKGQNLVYPISIRIKYGTIKRIRGVGIDIPVDHWDEGAGDIKAKIKKELYPPTNINGKPQLHPVVERMTTIQANIQECRNGLVNQTLDMDGALDLLIGKVEDGKMLEYVVIEDKQGNKKNNKIQPNNKLRQATINKYASHINAVQGHMQDNNLKMYTTLKFSHISSEASCKKIAKVLTENANLTDTTIAGYLKSLDKVWKHFKNLNKNNKGQFSKLGLIPAEKPSTKRKPVYNEKVFMALDKYNTIGQLEALLFWLYSFCLVGMDGVDIINVSEDLVSEKQDDKKLKVLDYFPFAQSFLTKRLHITRERRKVKGSEVVTMVNLFPTLLIRDMLHHCIKYTKPQWAYTGDDRLRLFNFYTKNEDGSTNPSGMAKWIDRRNYYNKICRKTIGGTTQLTRKTITRVGQDNNLPVDKLGSQIGHNIKGSIKYYLSEEQVELDIIQLQVFKDYKILHILKNIIDLYKDRTFLHNNKEVKWIPDSLLDIHMKISKEGRTHKFTLNDRRITLDTLELSNFSYQKEWEYQKLLKDTTEFKVVEEHGKKVQKRVPVDPKNYPDRLKELQKERQQEFKEKEKPVHIQLWDKLKQIMDEKSTFEMHNITQEKVS